MRKQRVLIVGGDDSVLEDLTRCFSAAGIRVTATADPSRALELLPENGSGFAVIGDCQDGSWSGVELGAEMRMRNPAMPLILLTGRGTEDLAVAAMRAGFSDYFKIPYSIDDIIASAGRISPNPHACAGNGPRPADSPPLFVGKSRAIRDITECIPRIANMEANVLISGESGTGKELVAGMIHRSSARRKKPFVCINCAAIPDSLVESELFGYEKGAFTGAQSAYEGKLKQAQGGTILLDEIGEMSPYAQAKMLRVVETKECFPLGGKRTVPLDLRIIAATNQQLENLVTEGRFRADLYYRLNVARIDVPPLRERKEDLLPLLEYYLGELSARFGQRVGKLSDQSLDLLLSYDWPGNIRELKNVLESLFVHPIPPMIMPEHFGNRLRTNGEVTLPERERVLSALSTTNWNKSKAAMKLNWSRMTLYRKMAKLRIQETESQKPKS